MPSTQSISHTTVAIALLASTASANITPCNTTICPSGDKSAPTCKYANMTASGIGILPFNSSLSPSSLLTWTVAVSKPSTSLNKSSATTTFQRDFLLGTPSSLKLHEKQDKKQACTLFFDGAASKLKFPGNDPRYDQGTCYSAMGTSCGLGLQFQAFAELGNILHEKNASDITPAEVCDKLAESLRSRPPTSCNETVGADWGNIIAKPLTSSSNNNNISHPLLSGKECNPTTEKGYNVSVIASSQIHAGNKDSSELTRALYGVTPILTVVYGEGMQDAELDFRCLKVIDVAGGKGLGFGDGGKVKSGVGRNAARGVVAAGVALGVVAVGNLILG